MHSHRAQKGYKPRTIAACCDIRAQELTAHGDTQAEVQGNEEQQKLET